MNARQKAKHYKKLCEELRALYFLQQWQHDQMMDHVQQSVMVNVAVKRFPMDDKRDHLEEGSVRDELVKELTELPGFKSSVMFTHSTDPFTQEHICKAYLKTINAVIEEEKDYE